ncbi:YtxH domain-containing protein [Parasediminibacterium sp. JCM 36343]|uniref:YtxH domain-containing protein n=1 Tax=Parasediminibacterium sp. JCM 36343 TaxID=3374279 RepID=UPI0039793E43
MTTTLKIFVGIFGAAAIGVTIGMLVNPEKTKEICDKAKANIADWSANLKNQVIQTASTVDEHVQEATA